MGSGNVYAVHDEDGLITMSNQVFGNEKYGDALNEHDLKFLQHDQNVLNTHTHYVKKPGSYFKSLAEREVMNIQVSKTFIKPDGKDVALFYGIPRDAMITVMARNFVVGSEKYDQKTPWECAAITPVLYTIMISKYPYRDWSTTIEARP